MTRARTSVVGIVVVLAVLAPASAQQPKPSEHMIYGIGGASCGRWLEYRRATNEWSAELTSTWVQGFVSGVGSEGHRLKNTDSAGMDAFIDQYCDAHRLDTIDKAAQALVRELTVKTP